MEPLQSDAIGALKSNPDAPDDYVSWLEQYGWGEFGRERYMLYSGLVDLAEFLEQAPSEFQTFGDNFGGVSGCFRSGGEGTVYEYDSATKEMRATGLRFPDFIALHKI